MTDNSRSQTTRTSKSKTHAATVGFPAAIKEGPGPANKPKSQPESKTGLVKTLLQRIEGATLDELVAATSWQPHTTRAALTGLRKKGHAIGSEKVDGVRRYRLDSAR